MTARAFAMICACAIALGGCRACTTANGETVFEKLDAAVSVEIVRSSTRGPGALFSNVGFVMRVNAVRPFDEPLPECLVAKYELGEDASGRLIAFRCGMGGEPWHLLRVSGAVHVRDCSRDLGVDRAPDFTKAQTLADAAPGILACHEKNEGGTMGRPLIDVYTALVDLLREAGGASAVRTFLAHTSDHALPPSVTAQDEKEEPWLVTLGELVASEHADVVADLCPALLDPSKSAAYVRAARLCPLVDSRVADAALDRVRAVLTASAPISRSDKWPSPLEWAMPIAATQRSIDAGAAACAFVATSLASDRRTELAFAAIAVSKTKCAAMRTLQACNSSLDCEGALCSAKDLELTLGRWRDLDSTMIAGVRARARPRLVAPELSAMYVLGPLPRDLIAHNARRHYEMDMGSGDACDSTLPPGAPCRCTSLAFDAPELCDLPLDGGRLVVGQCSFRADDRRKRIGEMEHVCPADAGCVAK